MHILTEGGSLLIFSGVLLAYWLIQAAVMLRRLAGDPVLSPDPPPLASAPLVSIVLPVRDEARNIEACIRSCQGQTHRNWELIIVDDRSADQTSELARSLREGDRRIRLLSNHSDPPPDWSGKVFANTQGAREARGEWLVFTDADTRHHPAHLQSALSYCLNRGVELLTVFPGLECPTFWEKVIQPFVFWLMWDYYPPAAANRPGGRRGGASGTFFLVKREAYERMGGWASVHDCIPDDVAFMERAQELKIAAHIVIGATIRVRMYHGFRESFAGWSRYMLSGANNNILIALLAIFYSAAFNVAPF
ncbi:MAG: glycosyltransferase, partial [Candidatus Aureabacteria bacterium]|nr:glycosyltransferase [Candidatus Auribacterota bacterium]